MARSIKSQASLEYLMIIALTFAVIIPTTYLFYSFSKQSGYEISDSQLTKNGRDIVDSSETIFYSGVGSKTILEFNFPDEIRSATIVSGRELIFSIATLNQNAELLFFSKVNMTTNPTNCIANICTISGLGSGGVKKLKVEAINQNSVSIDIS